MALPLLYALGIIRTTLVIAIAAVYLVFVSGVCTILVRGPSPGYCHHSLTAAGTYPSNTQGNLICYNSTSIPTIIVCSRCVVDTRRTRFAETRVCILPSVVKASVY